MNTLITWVHAGYTVGPWVNLINASYGLGASSAALLFVLVTSTLCACYACVGWYVYDCVLAHVSALDELHGQLSSFKVANLNCAVESDRAVVEAAPAPASAPSSGKQTQVCAVQ